MCCTPHTAHCPQDLNLSTERINSNRNFANKIWNAGKFILLFVDKVRRATWLGPV